MAVAAPPVDALDLSREEVLARIREGILSVRDDVLGVVVFGSFARGEAWHDIDVLVVLRERIATRDEWVAIMLQLHDATGLIQLDVIPTHLDGLRQGLAAHVPLLMEIAFDGQVVHDGDAVAQVLETAQKEILGRGIRRTETGWRFPVRYRQNTPLSARGNADRAHRWLTDAERDLGVATQLRGAGYFDRCVYHCQQSIERSVKAVLICFGALERTHWVGQHLRKEAARQAPTGWDERLEVLSRLSLRHEHAAIDARYVLDDGEDDENVWIPSEHYFEPEASAAIRDAQEALNIARQFVAWWFAPSEGRERNPAAPSA